MPHDQINTAQATRTATYSPNSRPSASPACPVTAGDVTAQARHVKGIFEHGDRMDMLIAFAANDTPGAMADCDDPAPRST